jgi:ferric-dicitrate binding protein FerR (iron transport regulator)
MKQIPENILLLTGKYQAGTLTPEERLLLNEWYHSFDDHEVEIPANENLSEALLSERIKLRLQDTIQQHSKLVALKPRRKWRLAAAAVLLLLSTSAYFIFFSRSSKQEIADANLNTTPVKNDIAPGANKALLTLTDGSVIILDSTSNGTIIQQGNIKVDKLKNGLLAYTINGKQITENDEAFYNTISTPRGGQYQLLLADGTKVWLNAASSIRFPVMFKGTERKVEITGEAYFEVTKNANMPFMVRAGASKVEVLGTRFNVNAYNDEAIIKTTLLEGLVKVSANNQSPKFLQPGQQSGISKDGKINVIANADTEEAVAWINGRFQYKSADIKTILRQISRWYDVDVEYRGNVNIHFTGQLPRNQYVSAIFEKLALTGEVKFKIDGKKIIVSPN